MTMRGSDRNLYYAEGAAEDLSHVIILENDTMTVPYEITGRRMQKLIQEL